MEKELQSDSITTVTIKPDYPPSEVYSSEPPPAYHRSQSSAVQVAKIIAVTVLLMSVILGGFLLASAYVTANASCRQLQEELELLNEAADRFQAPLQPEAFIEEESVHQKQIPSLATKSSEDTNNIIDKHIDTSSANDSENSDNDNSSEESEEEEKYPIHFKLPLQLDFDDLAGALIEKNLKSKMNCIVEKKQAEQVVDHHPKTSKLPLGLNLTIDPRREHITGEKMAIFCETINPQKQMEPEADSEEATIMIQPVMIPIPPTHFPAQMPRLLPQQNQFNPMEIMKPPMLSKIQQQYQNQIPPNLVLHHIAQEIIAQKIMKVQRAREEQQNQDLQSISEQNQIYRAPEEIITQNIPLPVKILSHLNKFPNRDVIVTVSSEDGQPELEEIHINAQEIQVIPQELNVMPQEMNATPQRIHPVSKEMQTRRSREFHNLIDSQSSSSQTVYNLPQDVNEAIQKISTDSQQQIQDLQQQKEHVQKLKNEQSYTRGFPVHIPVHMIQQEQERAQAASSEESRPHYVQPRSVRSVDDLVKSQKRLKRCSCDCTC